MSDREKGSETNVDVDADCQSVLRDTILRLIHRDLEAMQREVEGYPDDASLWKVVPGIENSGGSLALHVAGNLRHFVGAVVGETGYVRDRDAEFTTRNLTRSEVSRILDDAVRDVTSTFRAMDASIMNQTYPIKLGAGMALRNDVMLVHLAPHASYHLGQMDYHRRMITGDAQTMNTLPLGALTGPLPDVREKHLTSGS